MASSSPPSISVTLSIDPPSFSLGTAVDLSITAVSHAQVPITIFTWPTIFNLGLAQRRKNFTCLDVDTNTPVRLEITKGPKRPGFSSELGGRDDAYFHTLEPDKPVTFKEPFKLANRMGEHAATPGHRYRFSVREGETVTWWEEGRREDVMGPPEEEGNFFEAGREPIIVDQIDAIEFMVEEKPVESKG